MSLLRNRRLAVLLSLALWASGSWNSIQVAAVGSDGDVTDCEDFGFAGEADANNVGGGSSEDESAPDAVPGAAGASPGMGAAEAPPAYTLSRPCS